MKEAWEAATNPKGLEEPMPVLAAVCRQVQLDPHYKDLHNQFNHAVPMLVLHQAKYDQLCIQVITLPAEETSAHALTEIAKQMFEIRAVCHSGFADTGVNVVYHKAEQLFSLIASWKMQSTIPDIGAVRQFIALAEEMMKLFPRALTASGSWIYVKLTAPWAQKPSRTISSPRCRRSRRIPQTLMR